MEEITKILAASNFWLSCLVVFICILGFVGSPKRVKTIVARFATVGAIYFALTNELVFVNWFSYPINWILSYFIAWIAVNIFIHFLSWLFASEKNLIDWIMG